MNLIVNEGFLSVQLRFCVFVSDNRAMLYAIKGFVLIFLRLIPDVTK